MLPRKFFARFADSAISLQHGVTARRMTEAGGKSGRNARAVKQMLWLATARMT
jgi:hypothetical protein